MRVLGIDPGLHITGYGILEFFRGDPVVIEAGIVRSNQRDDFSDRLLEIGREMAGVIDQFKPDVIAVEELYSHYSHPYTAVIMGHVRGILYLLAAERHIPVVSYSATRIKKAVTGNGRATKAQMQRMVRQALALPTVPEPPDAADALAIALCHCRATEHNQTVAI